MERNSRKLIKLLKRHGWYQVASKGSHRQFKHDEIPGRITVTHPERDLPIGTVRSIYKKAQLEE